MAAGLVQVGKTGSQPLAQPVVGAGVAPVTGPGQVGHVGTTRELVRHRVVPGEKRQRGGG